MGLPDCCKKRSRAIIAAAAVPLLFVVGQNDEGSSKTVLL